jgi:3-isopropylmalate/(R)-2-methylmalate dehydratase large subunit
MPDETTVSYLWPHVKDRFKSRNAALKHYRQWASDEGAQYEKEFTLDVGDLVPQVTVGYKPDEVEDVTDVAGTSVDQVYIGSCTNGRINDLRDAAAILAGRTIAPAVRGIVSPATPEIYRQADAEGIIEIFMNAGFCVTNPTCGACLGMSNGVLAPGEVCASTTNRNFRGRMGRGGMVHLMSPATAAATAVAGVIADPREVRKKPAKRRAGKDGKAAASAK